MKLRLDKNYCQSHPQKTYVSYGNAGKPGNKKEVYNNFQKQNNDHSRGDFSFDVKNEREAADSKRNAVGQHE